MNFYFSYIFYYVKNSVKIGFLMPTAKNDFRFLIYTPKKNIFNQKSIFLDVTMIPNYLYFCQVEPGTLNNLDKHAFSGLLRVS